MQLAYGSARDVLASGGAVAEDSRWYTYNRGGNKKSNEHMLDILWEEVERAYGGELLLAQHTRLISRPGVHGGTELRGASVTADTVSLENRTKKTGGCCRHGKLSAR